MPTIETQKQGIAGRKEAGDAIIAAAKTQDTKPVRRQLAAFTKAHNAYVLAMAKVSAAESVRDLAQRAVGEADAAQDEAIEALARALVADGAPRTRPLEGLSKHSVSDLRAMAVEREAREALKLVEAVTRRAKASKEVTRAAKSLAASVGAVQKALNAVTPRAKLYQDTLNARDALGQPWEKTLAYLKRAVRVAEDEGATGLFEALFQRTATTTRRASSKPAKAAKPAGDEKTKKPA